MARRRFFVDAIHADLAQLGGEDARHLSRVLRAEVGQRFEISDNRRPYLAEVAQIGRDRVLFRLLEPLEARPQPVEAVLYAALVKFDRFEWIVEKATELGAAAIVPFEAGRSDKGLAQAAGKRVERWRRIAREASQQSRRDSLPEVPAPAAFDSCLADGAPCRYFLDEDPSAAPLPAALPAPESRRPGDRVALLTGPEGG